MGHSQTLAISGKISCSMDLFPGDSDESIEFG